LLAYRRSTGEVINDFQSGATEAGLLGNAERAGIPLDDVEVRGLSLEEWQAEEERVNGPLRDQAATEAAAQISEGRAVAAKLGLSDAEVRALAALVFSAE
jgi:hypothetical protein